MTLRPRSLAEPARSAAASAPPTGGRSRVQVTRMSAVGEPRTVVHFTDTEGFGGAEEMLLTIMAGLDRRRWRPVLWHHPEPRLLVQRAHELGVETREVPRVRGRHKLAYLPRFAWALRAQRAAVFHAHLVWPLRCTYGLGGAVLARIPAVVASQHLFAEIRSRRDVVRQRLVWSCVDRYVAVSEEVRQGLCRTLSSDRKVEVVRNGIRLAPYRRPVDTSLRAALSKGSSRPLVLTVARLDAQKGLPHLLAAAALVPETVFLVAGQGPEGDRLQAEAARLGVADRIVFLGHRDDIPDLLASADLFVLPSLFEGLPVCVLEAMAAGRAVIASAVGGTDEAVVHGETGLLVPPAMPAALASAIRLLLSDPALAKRMGQAGRTRVHREFSADAMVERISALYDEVLGDHGPR